MPSIRDPSLPRSTRRRTADARSRRTRGRRKGTVLILFAVLLVVLLGMLAFAIDIGVTVHHRASLQNAVDASAHAAASVLERGQGAVNSHEVRATARQYFERNHPEVTPNIRVGRWDPVTRVFEPGVASQLDVNAVEVSAQWQYASFFGRVLGFSSYRSGAEAIATGGRDVTGPRDIVLMIDQTTALLTPRPDEYAPGESYPNDYPLNAKRALQESAEQFIDYVHTNYPDDRIGISGFATDTGLEINLTDDAAALRDVFDISRPNAMIFSHQKYVDEAGGRYPGEPPRIGLALDGSAEGQVGGLQIATGANSRVDAKKILILVGDGSTTNDPDPPLVATQLAAAGFHIHTITVGPSNLLMRQLAVGDGRSYLVPTPASSPSGTYEDMLLALTDAFEKISGKKATVPKLVK